MGGLGVGITVVAMRVFATFTSTGYAGCPEGVCNLLLLAGTRFLGGGLLLLAGTRLLGGDPCI